ncbi:unnamed protein product, partial [Rotaria sordida]
MARRSLLNTSNDDEYRTAL